MHPGVSPRPWPPLGRPTRAVGPLWNVTRASGTSFGPRGSSTRDQKCLLDRFWKDFRCILGSFGGQKRVLSKYRGTCDASHGLGSIFVPISWLWWRCSCLRAFWRRGLGHCNLWDEKHIGNVHAHHLQSQFAAEFSLELCVYFLQKSMENCTKSCSERDFSLARALELFLDHPGGFQELPRRDFGSLRKGLGSLGAPGGGSSRIPEAS